MYVYIHIYKYKYIHTYIYIYVFNIYIITPLSCVRDRRLSRELLPNAAAAPAAAAAAPAAAAAAAGCLTRRWPSRSRTLISAYVRTYETTCS